MSIYDITVRTEYDAVISVIGRRQGQKGITRLVRCCHEVVGAAIENVVQYLICSQKPKIIAVRLNANGFVETKSESMKSVRADIRSNVEKY